MSKQPRPPDWLETVSKLYEQLEGENNFNHNLEAGADAIYPFAFEKGKQEGRKKLKRSRALRRDKSTPTSRSWDYDNYIGIGGDWDQEAMASLSQDDRIAMLEAYQKEHHKK